MELMPVKIAGKAFDLASEKGLLPGKLEFIYPRGKVDSTEFGFDSWRIMILNPFEQPLILKFLMVAIGDPISMPGEGNEAVITEGTKLSFKSILMTLSDEMLIPTFLYDTGMRKFDERQDITLSVEQPEGSWYLLYSFENPKKIGYETRIQTLLRPGEHLEASLPLDPVPYYPRRS